MPMAHGVSRGPVLHGCVLDHTCQSLNGSPRARRPILSKLEESWGRCSKTCKVQAFPLPLVSEPTRLLEGTGPVLLTSTRNETSEAQVPPSQS